MRGVGGVPCRALAGGDPRGRAPARSASSRCLRQGVGWRSSRPRLPSPGSGGEAFASRRSTGACSRTRSGGRPSSAPRSSARAGRASSRRDSPFASSASDGRRWSSGRSSIFHGVALRRRAPSRAGRERRAPEEAGRGRRVRRGGVPPPPGNPRRPPCGRLPGRRAPRRSRRRRRSAARRRPAVAGGRPGGGAPRGPRRRGPRRGRRARERPTRQLPGVRPLPPPGRLGPERRLRRGGAILLAWTLGLPRRVGEAGALLAIAAYVLAVGWQPSVVRAGVAGALASLAWLASRPRDRWYFLLAGAAVLLAWNPYGLLDPGFQLSFAAVASIFVLVPRIERALDGYPVPRWLTACPGRVARVRRSRPRRFSSSTSARSRSTRSSPMRWPRRSSPRSSASPWRRPRSIRSFRRLQRRSPGPTAGSPPTWPSARAPSEAYPMRRRRQPLPWASSEERSPSARSSFARGAWGSDGPPWPWAWRLRSSSRGGAFRRGPHLLRPGSASRSWTSGRATRSSCRCPRERCAPQAARLRHRSAPNNPGGLLDQAISVSDTFLERGEIVSTRGRDPEETQRFNARPGDKHLTAGKPIIVLSLRAPYRPRESSARPS